MSKDNEHPDESESNLIDLGHISSPLRKLAVLVDSLTPDPGNARLHSPRNITTIAASLKAFGQQTPIVVDSKGIIRKGNGTWQAAKSLGWTHIAAVKSELSGPELVGYAVADNRSGDPEVGSLFDQHTLAETLMALQQESGFDVAACGFNDDELAALIADATGANLPDDASGKPLDDAALAADVKTVTCPHCGKVVLL